MLTILWSLSHIQAVFFDNTLIHVLYIGPKVWSYWLQVYFCIVPSTKFMHLSLCSWVTTWIAYLVKFLPFKGNSSEQGIVCYNLLKEDLGRPHHKDHFSNWKFPFIYLFSRYWLKLKKTHVLSPFKGSNSNKKSSDNFDPMQIFVGLITRIILAS